MAQRSNMQLNQHFSPLASVNRRNSMAVDAVGLNDILFGLFGACFSFTFLRSAPGIHHDVPPRVTRSFLQLARKFVEAGFLIVVRDIAVSGKPGARLTSLSALRASGTEHSGQRSCLFLSKGA